MNLHSWYVLPSSVQVNVYTCIIGDPHTWHVGLLHRDFMNFTGGQDSSEVNSNRINNENLITTLSRERNYTDNPF